MNKKIKTQDIKKWLKKLFASFGIWMVLSIIIILTGETEKYIPYFAVASVIMVLYWIVTYNTTNKFISVKEFLEENKDSHIDYKKRILSKNGLSEKEINNVLKIKTSKKDEETTVEGRTEYLGSYTRTAFVIVLIVSIIIGIADQFLIGVIVFVFGLLTVVPIAYAIGASKQLNYNLGNNLPKQLDYLKENGIDTEEQYLSKSGAGIIIDRYSYNIAIVQSINPDLEPAIIPFALVKKCEYYENKTQRIKESAMGEVGVVFDNEYLKERGKYDERKIETIIKEMGIILTIGDDRLEKLTIPYYKGEINEDLLLESKVNVMLAVDNVNSIIGVSSKNDNKDLVKLAEELIEEGKVLSKSLEIKDKRLNDKRITKKEIDFLLENDSELDLKAEDRINIVDSLRLLQDEFENKIPKSSSDYKKMTKACNEVVKLMKKDKFMTSDQAILHNLNLDIKELSEKYKIDNVK